MVTVLALLGVLLVLVAAAVLSTREEPLLADAPRDAADVPLPDGPLAPEDVAELRFSLAPRGYRMSEVDLALERLQAELADRDRRIALLEAAAEGAQQPPEVREAAPADLPVTPPPAPVTAPPGMAPVVAAAPVEQPPVEQPPVEQPPVEQPPVASPLPPPAAPAPPAPQPAHEEPPAPAFAAADPAGIPPLPPVTEAESTQTAPADLPQDLPPADLGTELVQEQAQEQDRQQ